MFPLLLRRALRALVTLLLLFAAVFLLLRLVPGDPALAILGDQASPADLNALRSRLHLDESLRTQFLLALSDVFSGTLGTSFQTSRSVASDLFDVLPSTLALTLSSLLVALLVGLPIGALSAKHDGTWVGRALSSISVLGLAIPNILLGPLLLLTFGIALPSVFFSAFGVSFRLPLPGDEGALALMLPAITLGTALAASIARQTRAALLEVSRSPSVVAAKARGLPPLSIFFRYRLRPVAAPLVTVLAAQFGALLSGTVVVEQIFQREGVGTLFLNAFFARDFPVVQGVMLFSASAIVLINVALDFVYVALDPRAKKSLEGL